jgi:hypothetical protein
MIRRQSPPSPPSLPRKKSKQKLRSLLYTRNNLKSTWPRTRQSLRKFRRLRKNLRETSRWSARDPEMIRKQKPHKFPRKTIETTLNNSYKNRATKIIFFTIFPI